MIDKKLLNISLLLFGLTLIFIFSSNAVASADAQSVYVNGTSGNDAWDGTSPTHIASGVGPKKTIKSGVAAVATGATVNIAEGTYKEHGIILKKNMTIQGKVQKYVIIDGQLQDRIFTVNTGINITINNLKLINGQSTSSGGAIYSQGSLFINNCVIKNNKIPNRSAGAVYNKQGSLIVNNSDISYNSALIGGAIYTYMGSTTIRNTTLNYNRARNGAGGALVNNKGSLTLINCKLGDNKATPGFGGAIYNFLGRLKVTNTTFTKNTSPKGGGAIYTQDSVGTVYLTSNAFLYNNAYNGRGGGLYHCHGTIVMSKNVFTGNKASINGGAIYLDSTQHPSISYTKLFMDNSTFTSNLATNYSGAIYNNGTLKVTSCIYTSNIASTVSGGAITNAQGVLSVTKSTFKSNKAPKHYGGGIYNYRGKVTVTYSNFTSNTAYRGGAMYNDQGSLISSKNTFVNNKP